MLADTVPVKPTGSWQWSLLIPFGLTIVVPVLWWLSPSVISYLEYIAWIGVGVAHTSGAPIGVVLGFPSVIGLALSPLPIGLLWLAVVFVMNPPTMRPGVRLVVGMWLAAVGLVLLALGLDAAAWTLWGPGSTLAIHMLGAAMSLVGLVLVGIVVWAFAWMLTSASSGRRELE